LAYGEGMNLEEAIEYHKKFRDHKNFMKVARKDPTSEGKTVVFPAAGTPILEQEIELNKTLYESGLLSATGYIGTVIVVFANLIKA